MSSFFNKAAVAVLKAPLWFYSKAISPLLGPRCRFHPTCSSYAMEALDRHGAGRGLYLAVRRFLFCHPWSKRQGYDPVPPRRDEDKTVSAPAAGDQTKSKTD